MLYALIVAGLSLVGAAVPLRFHLGHAGLQVYLSLAAGALLGAALFHLLPEASEQVGTAFGLPTVAGIIAVFFLQRYLAPHSHETGADAKPDAVGVAEAHVGHEHGFGAICHHDHAGDAAVQGDRRGGFPVPVLGGAVAILSLSVHSFFDGVAIGAATSQGAAVTVAAAVFLSVLIHKPMDGLSVSVLLMNAGVKTRVLWFVQVLYAALVPLGVLGFWVSRGAISDPSHFVGYTLAFSGGTFLAIALTDLLPELHFHSHDRNKLSAALMLGLAVMGFTAYLGHGHTHADAKTTPQSAHSDDHSHDGHGH